MRLRACLLACLAASAWGEKCEEWCSHACGELNGNIEAECGGCDPTDPKFLCHTEAEDFAGWQQRATGKMAEKKKDDTDKEKMYNPHGDGQAKVSAYEYVDPHEHEEGACEFETIIDHKDVNRTWLLNHKRPVLIRGGTTDWKASTKWQRDSMLETYGDSYCEATLACPTCTALVRARPRPRARVRARSSRAPLTAGRAPRAQTTSSTRATRS